MANIQFYRGGKPGVNYMWHAGDVPEYSPPFTADPVGGDFGGLFDSPESPPYNSHADAAMNKGNFVLGMPIQPNGSGMTWQPKQLADAAVGDVVQCLWLPEDHVATYLNLKSVRRDDNMAGAKVALVAQKVQWDATNKEWTYTEDTDFATAVASQAGSNSFALDGTFNAFVSLLTASSDGYAIPMYSSPTLPPASASGSWTAGTYYIFGLKILSLPTDTNFTLANMNKGVYMSLRMEAFECPVTL